MSVLFACFSNNNNNSNNDNDNNDNDNNDNDNNDNDNNDNDNNDNDNNDNDNNDNDNSSNSKSTSKSKSKRSSNSNSNSSSSRNSNIFTFDVPDRLFRTRDEHAGEATVAGAANGNEKMRDVAVSHECVYSMNHVVLSFTRLGEYLT